MYWNKTITLYNRSEDPSTGVVSWYRHQIHNCFVKVTSSAIRSGDTQFMPKRCVIRIPRQSSFVPSHKWLSLPDKDKLNHLTLQTGDIVFLGKVDEIINEYSSGQRSSDLIAKHSISGAFEIKSLSINIDLPGAHYFVEGE